MKNFKRNKNHLLIGAGRMRRPRFAPVALGVLASALALAPCARTNAQFIGFGAGGSIGGTVGFGGGFGGGAPISLPIMINPLFPPILLVGMGDSVVYELLVSGVPNQSLAVQFAYAPAAANGYQWVTLTNFTLGVIASATVNLTIPFGQAWMIRVVVQTPPPPPGPTPDPARWASISAGTFVMGSPETEYDRSSDEGPQTQVTFSHGFWMEKFEVTEGEYSAVVGSNPASFSGDPNQPVEQVSWYDASNYCAMLTAQERTAGRLPSGYEYRLPTEAEWEYVARAGTTNRFFFGDDHGYSELPNYAWFATDSNGSTHDVGGKQPNPWGIYDTSGNVFEWCSDWYGPYSGGAVTDPSGAPTGSGRVMRGGSWRFPGGDARSAARNLNAPDFASYGIGIRVVLSEVRH